MVVSGRKKRRPRTDARAAAERGLAIAHRRGERNDERAAWRHDRVEGSGKYVIRGFACPLAAVTGKHPVLCLAMEVGGEPVRECCDRAERSQCSLKPDSQPKLMR